VQVLATRVGHLRVTSIPEGADITIDDEAVGRTPMAESLLVSVGRRKVVASMPGRQPVTSYVDVAAGDEAAIALPLPAPVEVTPAAPPPVQEHAARAINLPQWHASQTLVMAGWITTGTLAVAAGTLGILAIHESDVLRQTREGLVNPAPNPAAPLDHDANLTKAFSVAADSLTVAAIVTGGLSLYWTASFLSAPRTSGASSPPAIRVSFGPASARLETTF